MINLIKSFIGLSLVVRLVDESIDCVEMSRRVFCLLFTSFRADSFLLLLIGGNTIFYLKSKIISKIINFEF